MTDIERELSREIREAHNWLKLAHAKYARTNESDVRIHYVERWLRSLMRIARSLP